MNLSIDTECRFEPLTDVRIGELFVTRREEHAGIVFLRIGQLPAMGIETGRVLVTPLNMPLNGLRALPVGQLYVFEDQPVRRVVTLGKIPVRLA